MQLDDETIRDLRARQVEHVKARLRGDAGRAALAQNLAAGWRAILDAKVADVVEKHPDESVQIIRGWLNNAL